MLRCHLVFENDSTRLVAWDDCVKVVRIRERSREEIAGDPSSRARCAELVSSYEFVETEVICGIAPFGKDILALLIFLEPELVDEDADALEDGEHDGGVQDAARQDGVNEDEQGSAGSAVSGDSQPKEAIRARERLRARRTELRVLNRADNIETSIDSLPVSRFEENVAEMVNCMGVCNLPPNGKFGVYALSLRAGKAIAALAGGRAPLPDLCGAGHVQAVRDEAAQPRAHTLPGHRHDSRSRDQRRPELHA